MTAITAPLTGRRYGVYGLARSGRSVLAFLARSGADAVAWDANPAARDGVAAAIVDLDRADLARLDALVVSPGVPLNTHPVAARAKAAGVPVVGDIELFALARGSLPPHRVVGITGTNGKSTTTALIHHILVSAGVPAALGGNIGLPILDQPALPAGGVYVLELSSFQLDLTRSLACEVVVVLNVTPDHLDRYEGMAAYAAAKERLLTMRADDGVAVIATSDAHTRAMAARAGGRVERVTPRFDKLSVGGQAAWPALAGPHNAENAACAVAAVRALGVGEDAIEQGLATYPGLPHRMEVVATVDGVRFVNDSKATNVTAALPALASYPAIRWIAGGRAKPGDNLDLLMSGIGNVRAAYLVGEATALFADRLSGRVPVVDAGTVPAAVALAWGAAEPGDTVLLSPACASYDQFRDFEARGEAFRAAVQELAA